MASDNTLARRENEPRIRQRLLGPHQRTEETVDKPSRLIPTPSKPFNDARGTTYEYTRSGSLSRIDPKISRQRRRRACGGWSAYYKIRDEQARLLAEQA